MNVNHPRNRGDGSYDVAKVGAYAMRHEASGGHSGNERPAEADVVLRLEGRYERAQETDVVGHHGEGGVGLIDIPLPGVVRRIVTRNRPDHDEAIFILERLTGLRVNVGRIRGRILRGGVEETYHRRIRC